MMIVLLFFTMLGQALHVDIDADSKTLLAHIKAHNANWEAENKGAIGDSIEMGKRLLSWIDKYNQNNEEQFQLSDPNDPPKGFPLESPVINNDQVIKERLEWIRSQAPADFVAVLEATGPLPSSLGMSHADFRKWGKEVDRSYSRAVRWNWQRNNLSSYRRRKKQDISGYLFLRNLENRNQVLEDYHLQEPELKKNVRSALISLCQNNSQNSFQNCRSQFRTAAREKRLKSFYQQNSSHGRAQYNRFFRFYHTRSDISRSGKRILYPFKRPRSQRVRFWVKKHVEQTWQSNDWHLKLQFRDYAGTNIRFEPDVTPHVSNGNNIVMNSRQSLEDINTQWTLAHEFGHALGFRDCYLEFYDDDQQAMIYYEIDITNIMCSRAGKVNDTVVRAINRYYR